MSTTAKRPKHKRRPNEEFAPYVLAHVQPAISRLAIAYDRFVEATCKGGVDHAELTGLRDQFDSEMRRVKRLMREAVNPSSEHSKYF